MSELTPEPRWRVDADVQLVWRSWGEAHFAFDPRSSQTHFLNELAVAVHTLLENEPQTADELYRTLLTRYELDEDDALLETLNATLLVLDRLGLIVAT